MIFSFCFNFKKKITTCQKIVVKFHDFHSQIFTKLQNDFEFRQFSTPPRHGDRCGKFPNFKVLPMTYVEKSEISFIINKLCVQFMVFICILYCFVAKSVFLCIYAVLSRCTCNCVEKIVPLTNIRYGI